MAELTRDEAVVLLASLACASDGVTDQDEQALLRDRLAPNLSRLGVRGEAHAYDHLYDLLSERGPEWALDTIGRALPNRADRLSALRLAVELVDADGSVTSEEMEHIGSVAATLGLTRADLREANKGPGKAPASKASAKPVKAKPVGKPDAKTGGKSPVGRR